MKNIIYIFILSVFLTTCSKKKTDNFDIVYEVEMIANWSSTSHPIGFPSNAHFSPMVGLSHIASLDVIGEGLSATPGVKSMAETGETKIIVKEFEKLHNQKYGLDIFTGESFSSPGNNKTEIGVKSGYNSVSVFSMLAPSPDWFVAAKVNLMDITDGKWYNKVTVHAKVFDAGTDSGVSFTSANEATSPVESIYEINYGPLTNGTDSVRNIVTFIFTKIQ